MRALICFLLITFTANIFCYNVAKVGDTFITSEELNHEIEQSDEGITYSEKRQKAVENLIRKTLLQKYAKENHIFVSETELENYFISLYGDHQIMTTDGKFDPKKYHQLKNTPVVQQILQEMHEILLLEKVESIIKQDFSLSDDELLELYILENAQIDLGYAIIKMKQADVPPTCTPKNAFDYYNKNPGKFLTGKQIKLEMFIVSDKDVWDKVNVSMNEITDFYQQLNTWKEFDTVQDSIREQIHLKKSHSESYKEAERMKILYKENMDIYYPLIETPYLDKTSSISDFIDQYNLFD